MLIAPAKNFSNKSLGRSLETHGQAGSQATVYVSDSVLGEQCPDDRWTAQSINSKYCRPATV